MQRAQNIFQLLLICTKEGSSGTRAGDDDLSVHSVKSGGQLALDAQLVPSALWEPSWLNAGARGSEAGSLEFKTCTQRLGGSLANTLDTHMGSRKKKRVS